MVQPGQSWGDPWEGPAAFTPSREDPPGCLLESVVRTCSLLVRNVHFCAQDGLRKSPPIHVQTPVSSAGALTSKGHREPGGMEGPKATEGERVGLGNCPSPMGLSPSGVWGTRPLGLWTPAARPSTPGHTRPWSTPRILPVMGCSLLRPDGRHS